MRKIIFFISSLTIIFVSKFFWKIIKGSHQGVIRQSLNSHYIGIIEQPSNSHPAVIKQSVDRHQAVIGKSWGSHWASESSRQSSGSHQTVRQSSGSHGQSLGSHQAVIGKSWGSHYQVITKLSHLSYSHQTFGKMKENFLKYIRGTQNICS